MQYLPNVEVRIVSLRGGEIGGSARCVTHEIDEKKADVELAPAFPLSQVQEAEAGRGPRAPRGFPVISFLTSEAFR